MVPEYGIIGSPLLLERQKGDWIYAVSCRHWRNMVDIGVQIRAKVICCIGELTIPLPLYPNRRLSIRTSALIASPCVDTGSCMTLQQRQSLNAARKHQPHSVRSWVLATLGNNTFVSVLHVANAKSWSEQPSAPQPRPPRLAWLEQTNTTVFAPWITYDCTSGLRPCKHEQRRPDCGRGQGTTRRQVLTAPDIERLSKISCNRCSSQKQRTARDKSKTSPLVAYNLG